MELPKFVKLGNTSLRLRGNKYFRDAGIWDVDYKIIDDVLLSWKPKMGTPWLHRKPLIEITEEEWRKDNGHYAPSGV